MIKFHYFGDTSKAFTNVIVAASSVTKNEDGTGTVRFGLSFSCSTDRYDKQFGKHLAIKRLESADHLTTYVDNITFSDICDAISSHISQMQKNPSWVKAVIGEYSK